MYVLKRLGERKRPPPEAFVEVFGGEWSYGLYGAQAPVPAAEEVTVGRSADLRSA